MTKTDRRHRLLPPLLAGLVISFLAGCTQPKPAPPPVQKVEAPPPPERHYPRRRHVPLPPRKPEAPPEAGENAPKEGSQTFAILAPSVAPHQLIGLDEASASRLLGAATSQSSEPPAKVWRYKTASCELDLYFYYDLRSARMRTLRYSVNGGAGDQGQAQQCIDAVAARRRG